MASVSRAGLPVALALSTAAAVVFVAAVAAGLTTPDAAGAAPVAAVLAFVLPLLVAVACRVRGHRDAAAGVLTVAGLFGLANGVGVGQLAAGANSALRPDLLLPDSLTLLRPAAGTWLLLVAHLLVVAAGVLAAALRDPAGDEEPPRRRGGVAAVTIGVLVVLILLFVAPFTSTDVLMPGLTVLERPGLELACGVLLLVMVLAGPVVAAVAPARQFGTGALLGTAAALLALAVEHVTAGLAAPGLGVSAEPYALLLAALLTAGAALLPDRGRTAEDTGTVDLVLPGQRRLLLVTAVLGLATAATTALAGTVRLIDAPVGVDRGVTVPAAVLVAVSAAALLVPRFGALVRPAFTTVLAAVPLGLFAAADGVVTATSLGGVAATGGVWWLAVALVLAAAAAICAVVAGGVERDDVDMSERVVRPVPLGAGVFGGLLALVALAAPVVVGQGYVAPGLVNDFRMSSWGLLIALLAVLAAALLAGFSRPRPCGALLVGAALVLLVRAAELPLAQGRVPDAAPGAGLWGALAGAVVLLAGAGFAGSGARAGDGSGHGAEALRANR